MSITDPPNMVRRVNHDMDNAPVSITDPQNMVHRVNHDTDNAQQGYTDVDYLSCDSNGEKNAKRTP